MSIKFLPGSEPEQKTLEQRLFKTYTVTPNPIVQGRLAIAAAEKDGRVLVLKPKTARPKK